MNKEYEYDNLLQETDKAWLLDIEGEEIWFPKSQCNLTYGDSTYILVPDWLAGKKGLI
jgi:hypothetical protein